MVRIVFNYDKDNRPRAEVVLSHGKREFITAPIIDSGADITVIPKSIGEELGLAQPTEKEIDSIKNEKMISADGSHLDYVLRKVVLTIGNLKFEMEVAWTFNKDGQFLLGRDIFEDFDILFKQNPNKTIIFETEKTVFN